MCMVPVLFLRLFPMEISCFFRFKIRASVFCLSPLALDLRAQFCCCAVERFVKNWNMCPCFSKDPLFCYRGKSANMKMMLETTKKKPKTNNFKFEAVHQNGACKQMCMAARRKFTLATASWVPWPGIAGRPQ